MLSEDLCNLREICVKNKNEHHVSIDTCITRKYSNNTKILAVGNVVKVIGKPLLYSFRLFSNFATYLGRFLHVVIIL